MPPPPLPRPPAGAGRARSADILSGHCLHMYVNNIQDMQSRARVCSREADVGRIAVTNSNAAFLHHLAI